LVTHGAVFYATLRTYLVTHDGLLREESVAGTTVLFVVRAIYREHGGRRAGFAGFLSLVLAVAIVSAASGSQIG
jgi:hypothetical protein